MSGKGGTLVHAGDPEWGGILTRNAKASGVYGNVTQHNSLYDALGALKRAPKEELRSIRIFVLEDRMPLVQRSPNSRQQMQSLFKEEEQPPEREMRAVFLAGKIKQLYKEKGLPAPPIVMATVVSENKDRAFPNIDGVYEYSGDSENIASEISRMSITIAARSRT